jgi:hypothetical protein
MGRPRLPWGGVTGGVGGGCARRDRGGGRRHSGDVASVRCRCDAEGRQFPGRPGSHQDQDALDHIARLRNGPRKTLLEYSRRTIQQLVAATA